MTLVVDTITSAPNADYVLNSIDTALLANGYEKVADVAAGGVVVKPYRVYKNPQAQNGCPHDWFLAIKRDNDANLTFMVGEEWDGATHLLSFMPTRSDNNTAILESNLYRIKSARYLSTDLYPSGWDYSPWLVASGALTGSFCVAVTPQSFSFSRNSSSIILYVGRFEPMNNHAQENGFGVFTGGLGNFTWMPTRIPGATYAYTKYYAAQPLGPFLSSDRLLAGRPRAARALLTDQDAARGVMKDVLLLNLSGQWGDVATVDTDGTQVDYVNVGMYIRAALL